MSSQLDEPFNEALRLIGDLACANLSEEDVRTLETVIVSRLAALRNAVELQRLNAELNPGAESPELLTECARFEHKITLAYRRLEGAQASYRRNRARLWAKKREELHAVEGKEEEMPIAGKAKNEPHTVEDRAVVKSESITASLRRIHQMARNEVLKSELNIDELDTSTKSLTELDSNYTAVDVMLNGSRRLVQILDEADSWDRRCMMASLSFLAAVVMWIVYRRILKLPMKLLFWSLARTFGLVRWLAPAHKQATDDPAPLSTLAETLTAASELMPESTVVHSLVDRTVSDTLVSVLPIKEEL